MTRFAIPALAAGLALALLVPSAFAQDTIVSTRVTGALPLDPGASQWRRGAALKVELQPQSAVAPAIAEASVTEIRVQSLNNGREIAFRLQWRDPSEDRFQIVGQFSDAVAVQIPYRPSDEVPITMGDKGERVLILHWAAFRQENIERGFADTAKLHPNFAYDWYPHATAPYKYPDDWRNQYALAYLGGEKVFRKNTLKTPVREVVAEGFGSSTWKDVQGADGKGVYRSGGWEVVIKRLLTEPNTSNPDWAAGKSTFATFAVWDGGKNERGSRKSLGYAWSPLKIQ